MQEIRASSPAEGDVSWDFSSCSRNLGYILESRRGWPLKTCVCSAASGLMSSYGGQLRKQTRLGQDNTDASGGDIGDRGSHSNWLSDIGLPIHFQEESGIVTF